MYTFSTTKLEVKGKTNLKVIILTDGAFSKSYFIMVSPFKDFLDQHVNFQNKSTVHDIQIKPVLHSSYYGSFQNEKQVIHVKQSVVKKGQNQGTRYVCGYPPSCHLKLRQLF